MISTPAPEATSASTPTSVPEATSSKTTFQPVSTHSSAPLEYQFAVYVIKILFAVYVIKMLSHTWKLHP